MHNSLVPKGTEKQILFLSIGIVGKHFSNQPDK
jgi:hypothetical protein